MPRLPVGGNEQTVSTQQSVVRQDPGIVSAAAGETSRGASQLFTLSQAIKKEEDVWKKAAVTNQLTVAENEKKSAIASILQDAEDDPDHNNSELYFQRLEEELKKDVFIGDENVKAIYESDTQLDFDVNELKLRSLFRRKMVDHQRGEFVKTKKTAYDNYINSDSEIVRENFKTGYLQRLQINKDAGFLRPEEYEEEIIDVESWEVDRAIRKASTDPNHVLRNPDQFDIKDSKDRVKVESVAKATIATREREIKTARLKMQTATESDISKMIFKDKTMTIADKVLQINEMELNDQISTTYAAKARRYLTNVRKLDEVSNNKSVSRILRMMYDANNRYDSDRNPQKYLESNQSIQSEIIGADGVSQDDRDKLQEEFDRITKKKLGEASIKLTKDSKTSSIYKPADDYFQTVLPVYMRDEALRQFFYEVNGKDLDEKQSKLIAQQVSYSVMTKNNEKVKGIMQSIRTKLGENADIRMEMDGDKVVVKQYMIDPKTKKERSRIVYRVE